VEWNCVLKISINHKAKLTSLIPFSALKSSDSWIRSYLNPKSQR
jgi:hypothetical protein